MKWVFYVIVIIYMFYRAVYGAKAKEAVGVSIEPIKYDVDKNFLLPGVRKTISCIASNKNQKSREDSIVILEQLRFHRPCYTWVRILGIDFKRITYLCTEEKHHREIYAEFSEPVEWIDPRGKTVKRIPTNRIFVQENYILRHRTRVSAHVLVFTSVAVEDSGVWECRAGEAKQNLALCVIDPPQFLDTTPTVVTVDGGRSITLSCQVRGEPRVLWYRNGDIIADDVNSTKYQVMTKYNSQGIEGLLTITSVEPEDSGIYICESIEENPLVDDCIYRQSINISLQVNHAPVFIDGNETTIVYGTEGESISLTCSASGFPVPTYRWFKKIDDTLSEFSPNSIELLNDGAEAVLTLAPNSFSWNEKFMCRATNHYGDVDKTFLLVKTQIPTEPSEIRANSDSVDTIQLELIWDTGVIFPVNSIDVQYLEVKSLGRRRLKDSDWVRSKKVELKSDALDEGLNVTLPELKEETKYWIRLRAVNTAGHTGWTKPVMASTKAESEVTEEPEDSEESKETEMEMPPPEAEQAYSDSTFYGIFFAGGILVIAVAAMFLMRLV